jgi:hypothetical protein
MNAPRWIRVGALLAIVVVSLLLVGAVLTAPGLNAEQWTDVVTTAVIVTGGFATGVVVAAIGFRANRQLEERRTRREDNLRYEERQRLDAEQLEERERRNRDRWASERRELYGRCIRSANELVTASRLLYQGKETDWPWHQSDIDCQQAALEIQLVNEKLGKLADALYFEASELAVRARDQPIGDDVPAEEERERPAQAAAAKFIKAARKDLA